ncbi:site-specific integrase [Bradyrhizobium sp. CNPSo 4010]|uniref:Site-specific integrase n=1 Tax=Bradyrhizobium agreste TaxID=2751811 RepID=A0ABS0PK28_9BRAD|nr:site-specific integrase [Bradyrhizobium agreste]MBH5397262.1 site-specific integrase [Bradyrhizobium agreste]
MPKILKNAAQDGAQADIYLAGREAKLPGFDPFFAMWINNLRGNSAADNTVSTYAIALRSCLQVLSEVTGADVSVDAFRRLGPNDINKMQEAMSNAGDEPNTIVVKMSALRAFARFLHDHCSIRCDGILVSRLLTYGRGDRHVLESEDRGSLLGAARSDHLNSSWQEFRTRALASLLSTDGLKLGEALGLDFWDVSLARGSVLVRKGPQSRIVSLSSPSTEAIGEYLAVCPFNISDGWPLLVGKFGDRLTKRAAELSIADLRNQLGLHERMDSSAFRNGRVRELRALGHNDVWIMRELGFSSRVSLQDVFANEPPNYAAAELAAHHVRKSFVPARTDHNATDEVTAEVPSAPRSPEVEAKSSVRERRKRAANVRDGDAAGYIDHLFKTKPHNTAVTYCSVVREFADKFLPSQQKAVRDANAEDIASFQSGRSATRGAASAIIDRAALKGFYVYLFERGAVASIPVLDLKAPQRPDDRIRNAAATVDVREWVTKLWEYTALHPSNFNLVRLQAFVSLLALQGLKSNEALGLRKSALLGETLDVKGRSVILAPHTKAALRMAIGLPAYSADFIFPGREGGQSMNHRTMLMWVKSAQERLNLPKVTPEQLTQAFRRNLYAVLGDALETAKAVGLRSSDQFAAGQRAHVARKIEAEQHPMTKLM